MNFSISVPRSLSCQQSQTLYSQMDKNQIDGKGYNNILGAHLLNMPEISSLDPKEPNLQLNTHLLKTTNAWSHSSSLSSSENDQDGPDNEATPIIEEKNKSYRTDRWSVNNLSQRTERQLPKVINAFVNLSLQPDQIGVKSNEMNQLNSNSRFPSVSGLENAECDGEMREVKIALKDEGKSWRASHFKRRLAKRTAKGSNSSLLVTSNEHSLSNSLTFTTPIESISQPNLFDLDEAIGMELGTQNSKAPNTRTGYGLLTRLCRRRTVKSSNPETKQTDMGGENEFKIISLEPKTEDKRNIYDSSIEIKKLKSPKFSEVWVEEAEKNMMKDNAREFASFSAPPGRRQEAKGGAPKVGVTSAESQSSSEALCESKKSLRFPGIHSLFSRGLKVSVEPILSEASNSNFNTCITRIISDSSESGASQRESDSEMATKQKRGKRKKADLGLCWWLSSSKIRRNSPNPIIPNSEQDLFPYNPCTSSRPIIPIEYDEVMYDHDVIQPEDKRITLSQLKQLMADPLVDYLALVVDLICSPTCAETHPTLAHSVRFIIPDKGSKVDTDGIANLFNTRLSRLRTVQTRLRMELEPLRVLILRHRVTKACIINNGENRIIMDINAIIEKGNNKDLEKNSKNAEEDTKNEILPKSRLQFHLLEINETAEEIEEQAHWLCKSVGSFNGMAWLRPPTELAGGRIWLLDTFDEHSEEIEKKENAKHHADKFYEPRLLQSCHIKYIVSRLSIDRVLLVAKDAPADVDNVETLIDVYQSRVGCPCLLVPADWASNDLERMRSELARITNFLANGQCPQRMSSENGLQENDQHRPSHRIMVLGGGNGGAVCLAVALLMLLLRWRMPAAYHHLRSARSRPPLLPVQLTCLWQLDQALFAGLTKTRSAHVAGPYDKGGLGKSKVVKGKLKRRAAFFRRQDTEVPLPILAHTLTGIKPKTFFLTDIELLEDTTQVEQQGLSQVDDSSKHRIKDLALKKKLDRHTKKSGEKSKKYLKWINREIDPNSLLEMHSNEVLGQNGEKPNGKDHAQIMSEDTLVMRITAEDLEGFDTDELMQSNK